ncbi:MAG TPA: HAMP domain-containing sensor histidine kinase [Gemmatimonadales bacterium]|jgi:signal transduction histidine kinase|nr:HAMP domain-containing sensor histidine kinase [Gemmatimonadales bacterium]
MSALTELPRGGLRRAGPPALIAAALLFGVLSVGYAWIVARHLRNDARETSRLLGQVFAGLNDPREGAAADALLALADEVRHLGIPIAVTDTAGRITALDNAPFGANASDETRRNWIEELDRIHPPLIEPGVGMIHYGALPAARAFTGLAILQGAMFLCLVLLAAWAMRERVSSARDRLWVAMARESAHQLGTPLMSLTGWIDYLRENPGTPGSELIAHLEADAERLQRVAKRFERIGRPARREPVGLGVVAERVVAYFRPRLPTLAHSVTITLTSPGAGPTATGDPVLIEWALEVVVKNAVDALSGRGGRIEVEVEGTDSIGRVSVRDDGPGVAPDMQRQLFEPGVSSKTGGWGIGLALARRIVEQQHGGRVGFRPGAQGRGSEFVLEFPLSTT